MQDHDSTHINLFMNITSQQGTQSEVPITRAIVELGKVCDVPSTVYVVHIHYLRASSRHLRVV